MTTVLCYYVIKNWKINKNKILIIIIIIMTIIIILLCLLYLWKSQDLSDIVRTVAGLLYRNARDASSRQGMMPLHKPWFPLVKLYRNMNILIIVMPIKEQDNSRNSPDDVWQQVHDLQH